MTEREAAIVSAYTGIMIGDFGTMHAYIEEKMNMSIFTHQLADRDFVKKMKEVSREDFINISVGE